MFPFVIFLAAFIFMISDQEFYRYQTVLEFVVSWRVMDFVLISLIFTIITLLFASHKVKKARKPFLEKVMMVLLAFYVALGILAVFRGLTLVGSWAIGVGRYSLLEILYLPITMFFLNTPGKLKLFLRVLAFVILPIWFFHLILNIERIPLLLAGDQAGRFVDAATAFGLANISILLLPFAFRKNMRKHYFHWMPLNVILVISLFMVILMQHRSVWVAAFAGIFTVVFLGSRGRQRIRVLVGSLAILIFLGVVMYLVDTAPEGGNLLNELATNKLAFLRGFETDPTAYWRIRGWNYVVNRTLQNSPWLGFGFSETGWVDWNGSVIEVWEHNQYIHFFRASGIIGVLSYLAFLGTSLLYGLRVVARIQLPFYKTLAIGATAGLVMSMSYMIFYNQVGLLWFNIAVLLIIPRIGRGYAYRSHDVRGSLRNMNDPLLVSGQAC